MCFRHLLCLTVLKEKTSPYNKTLEQISKIFRKDLKLVSNPLKQGPGPTLGFQGHTQQGWGPERCGITLQQIKSTLNHPCINRDTSMRDVVKLAIKPTTKQKGMGYALLLNQDEPLHADAMVSVSCACSHEILSLSL